MVRFLSILLLAVFTTATLAEDQRPKELEKYGPQVDWTEVGRWGDRVVISGEGHKDGGEVLYSMAMDPPEVDNDRWYVTVWGPSNDPATKALVDAFAKDNNLAPFVADPPATHGQPHKPWSHFNWYRPDDPMQKWRFEKYQIANGPFPIITIQPPTNGHFGDPKVIVDRIDAVAMQGGPKVIGARIRASVDLYCKKLVDGGFQPPREAIDVFYEGGPTPAGRGEFGQAPWGPTNPPPVQPLNPQWPLNGPASDPTVTPVSPPANVDSRLMDLLGSPTFYLIIIAVLRLWETLGPIFGFKGTLANLLRELLEKNNPQPVPSPATPTVVPPAPPGTVTVLVPDGKGGTTPIHVKLPTA